MKDDVRLRFASVNMRDHRWDLRCLSDVNINPAAGQHDNNNLLAATTPPFHLSKWDQSASERPAGGDLAR